MSEHFSQALEHGRISAILRQGYTEVLLNYWQLSTIHNLSISPFCFSVIEIQYIHYIQYSLLCVPLGIQPPFIFARIAQIISVDI